MVVLPQDSATHWVYVQRVYVRNSKEQILSVWPSVKNGLDIIRTCRRHHTKSGLMTMASLTTAARPLLRKGSTLVRLIQYRTFASGGTRGSRGHGWYHKYRQGLGGRHLQGEYWDAPSLEEKQEWNDSIFAYGSQDVSLTIELDGSERHTLQVELASTVLPKTSENFQLLLEEGFYDDSIVYSIEKGVGLCMGDVFGKDGKGGACHEKFALTPGGSNMETEPLVLAHVPGILTMLSPGIDKVDSRFVICTHPAPQLDGRHVAFARLKGEGSLKLVQDWEESIFTKRGRPTIDMKIVASEQSDSDEASDSPATA